MGKPRFFWENEIINATLTASAEDAGYPIDNVATWREYEIWAASGAAEYTIIAEFGLVPPPVACLAIAGHNLWDQQATIKIEGSDNPDDSNPTYTLITLLNPDDAESAQELDEYAPESNFCTLLYFYDGTVVYQAYRITITAPGSADIEPEIGLIYLGDWLEMETGAVPTFDPDGQEDFGTIQRSETGAALGHALDFAQRKISMSFDHLSPSWIESTWKPFWAAHRFESFLFSWDWEGHRDAVYLMQFDSEGLSAPLSYVLYRGLNFTVVGRLEE